VKNLDMQTFRGICLPCYAFRTLWGFWLHISTFKWQITTTAKQLKLLAKHLTFTRKII